MIKLRKTVSVLLILLPVLFFGMIDRPTQMAIALFAGFASAFIINIEKFESFKAWKLEAKIRKVNKVIDEANATIEQLESVANPLLKSSLILLLHDGTFDGMDVNDKENIFLELLNVKEILKLNTVDEYITRAAKGVANDHFLKMLRISDDESFKEEFEKYTWIDFAPETPSVEELERYFKRRPHVLTDDVRSKFIRFKEFKNKHL